MKHIKLFEQFANEAMKVKKINEWKQLNENKVLSYIESQLPNKEWVTNTMKKLSKIPLSKLYNELQKMKDSELKKLGDDLYLDLEDHDNHLEKIYNFFERAHES